MVENGQKYLVTLDNWFVAPDGQQYRAAWGRCCLRTTKDVFEFTPSRPSTNWFLIIGSEGKEVIVAGCQIHFCVRCEDKPQDQYVGQKYIDKDMGIERNASTIYIAE